MHDALPKILPLQTLVAINALVISCLNGSTNTYGLFRETLLAIVAGECRPDGTMATSPYIQSMIGV